MLVRCVLSWPEGWRACVECRASSILIALVFALVLALINPTSCVAANQDQGHISLSKSIFVSSETRAPGSQDAETEASTLAVNSSRESFNSRRQTASHYLDEDAQVEQGEAQEALGQGEALHKEEIELKDSNALLTGGLFEDEPRDEPTLLQTIKSQTRPGEQGPLARPIERLDRDFLLLFDELWHIKDTSAIELVQLKFFNNQTAAPKVSVAAAQEELGNTYSSVPGKNTNSNKFSPDVAKRNGSAVVQWLPSCAGQAGGQLATAGACTPPGVILNSKPARMNPARGSNQAAQQQQQQQQQQQSRAKQDNLVRVKLAQAAGWVSSWLSEAQVRLRRAKERLYAVSLARVTPATKRAPETARSGTNVASRRAQLDARIANDYLAGADLASLTPADASALDAAKKSARSRRSASISPVGPSDDETRVSPGDDIITSSSPAQPVSAAALMRGGQNSGECNRLTIDEAHKCHDLETLVNVNLNHSFPGTTVAIEYNCKHITHLLVNCWPAQLDQLKQSLSSWSDNLLVVATASSAAAQTIGSAAEKTTTTTSMMTTSGGAQGAPSLQHGDLVKNSCGVEPRSPQYIRDRVSWMWLNLCVDKRFRQDYVDNLRCLSTWSQEKAQQVCTPEYKRMQTYLASQTGQAGFEWIAKYNNQSQQLQQPSKTVPTQATAAAASDAAAAPNTTTTTKKSGSPTREGSPGAVTSGASAASGRQAAAAPALTESELVDRELYSKLLCCMFDQFLRCVHKQAIRDCGRPGAQFVVNFLSRIGTDDMKHLCNSEAKSASPMTSGGGVGSGSNVMVDNMIGRARPSASGGSTQGGNSPRRSAADRYPFIESNYCMEPKILAALLGQIAQQGGTGGTSTGGSTGSSSSKNAGSGRNKARPGNAHLSHDPTFFGSMILSTSGAGDSDKSSPPLIILAISLFVATFVALRPSPVVSGSVRSLLCT